MKSGCLSFADQHHHFAEVARNIYEAHSFRYMSMYLYTAYRYILFDTMYTLILSDRV